MDHADLLEPDEAEVAFSKSLCELLDEQNWEEIIPMLVIHAKRKLRGFWLYGILGGGEGSGPGGVEAADIAMDAIQDVFVGAGVADGTINEDEVSHIRRWDPGKDPEILPYLIGVVDSKIWKLVTSRENRKGRRLAQQPTPAGSESYDPKLYNKDLPSGALSPEDQFVDAQIEQRAEDIVWGFHTCLDGEDLLQRIVECIIEGPIKPEDIAGKLGVESKDIYNAKKRLQRKLREYREREGKETAPQKGGKNDGK